MSAAPVLRPIPPAYTVDEDVVAGIVRMTVEGFFDLETLAQHFAENAAFVDRWRALGRPIRVRIDARNLMPHTPECQAFVQKSVERIYRPGDRVAIIASSNLAKMQMRRAHSCDDIIHFFVSDMAAMTWLKAFDS